MDGNEDEVKMRFKRLFQEYKVSDDHDMSKSHTAEGWCMEEKEDEEGRRVGLKT